MSVSSDPSPSLEAAPTARGRVDAFARIVSAGVARLCRPVRPRAAPSLRLFDSWAERFSAALVGLAVIIAGMAYVDPLFPGLRGYVRGPAAFFWEMATDVGRSTWILVPSGVGLLVILAVAPPVRSFADRVMLALAARLAFVFIAVGGSGLIVTTVKRVIARGRPRYFEEFGSLHFQFPSWQSSYASFPSGHSQTAFAIALALAALFPHWRRPLIAAAVVVALSRVVVDAHYFTDIVAGSLWGAWFTVMTRDWFARRALVFAPGPGRRPFPMPWRRVRQALGRIVRRLRP
mgnify:CR=1 FL=1